MLVRYAILLTAVYGCVSIRRLIHRHNRPEMEPMKAIAEVKVASMIVEPKPLTGWKIPGWFRTQDRGGPSKH